MLQLRIPSYKSALLLLLVHTSELLLRMLGVLENSGLSSRVVRNLLNFGGDACGSAGKTLAYISLVRYNC